MAQETGATFVKTDASQYQELLRLFDEAYKKHGAIDHAIANAGIYEPKGMFDPASDLQSLEKVRLSECTTLLSVLTWRQGTPDQHY